MARSDFKKIVIPPTICGPAILFVIAGWLSLVCSYPMMAQTEVLTLGAPDAKISGDTGPYATVTITLTSPTTANVEFDSLTNGGNLYLIGDGGVADLNVNGTYAPLSSVVESSSVGFSPTFKDNVPGQVNGFGVFNLSLNNTNASDLATQISFSLTDTSGSWSSVSDVLIGNNDGYLGAAHIFPCPTPCSTSSTIGASGYAAGNEVTLAPEPASMLLFGTGLLAIGTVVRRRRLTAA
jgi:hypothetical protein